MIKKVTPERRNEGPVAEVDAVEVSTEQTQELLARFVSEFVAPQKKESLATALSRRPTKQKPIDYERYLRLDRTSDVTDGNDLFRWLSADNDRSVCFFFHREAFRPASRFRISSLREAAATSWPGLFVNFEAGRALVVTLDRERFRCDLARTRQTKNP